MNSKGCVLGLPVFLIWKSSWNSRRCFDCYSSSFVLPVVESCGKKGIRNIVVITAGFKEIGGEGQNGNKTSRTYSTIRSLRCGSELFGSYRYKYPNERIVRRMKCQSTGNRQSYFNQNDGGCYYWLGVWKVDWVFKIISMGNKAEE